MPSSLSEIININHWWKKNLSDRNKVLNFDTSASVRRWKITYLGGSVTLLLMALHSKTDPWKLLSSSLITLKMRNINQMIGWKKCFDKNNNNLPKYFEEHLHRCLDLLHCPRQHHLSTKLHLGGDFLLPQCRQVTKLVEVWNIKFQPYEFYQLFFRSDLKLGQFWKVMYLQHHSNTYLTFLSGIKWLMIGMIKRLFLLVS